MSAAQSHRCTYCSIQYPPGTHVCMICRERTWPMYKTGPDEDWREKVRKSLGFDPPEEEQKVAFALPHPPDLSIALHIADGRMWVPHDVLIDAGYSYLEDGSIVFVNNRFYELIGYSQSRKMWWVEELVVDGAFDDITPEDIIGSGDNGR